MKSRIHKWYAFGNVNSCVWRTDCCFLLLKSFGFWVRVSVQIAVSGSWEFHRMMWKRNQSRIVAMGWSPRRVSDLSFSICYNQRVWVHACLVQRLSLARDFEPCWFVHSRISEVQSFWFCNNTEFKSKFPFGMSTPNRSRWCLVHFLAAFGNCKPSSSSWFASVVLNARSGIASDASRTFGSATEHWGRENVTVCFWRFLDINVDPWKEIYVFGTSSSVKCVATASVGVVDVGKFAARDFLFEFVAGCWELTISLLRVIAISDLEQNKARPLVMKCLFWDGLSHKWRPMKGDKVVYPCDENFGIHRPARSPLAWRTWRTVPCQDFEWRHI